MSKRYEEAIEVLPDPTDRHSPLAFCWRGRRYDIDQCLSNWLEGGEWWHARGPDRNDHGPRDREYFRVLARPAGTFASGELDADGFMATPSAVYDLFFDRIRRTWKLARVWD